MTCTNWSPKHLFRILCRAQCFIILLWLLKAKKHFFFNPDLNKIVLFYISNESFNLNKWTNRTIPKKIAKAQNDRIVSIILQLSAKHFSHLQYYRMLYLKKKTDRTEVMSLTHKASPFKQTFFIETSAKTRLIDIGAGTMRSNRKCIYCN